MVPRAIVALLFAAAIGSFPRAGAADDATDAARARILLQRQKYRQGLADYPLLSQHKVSEVFRLRMDGPSLALETPLEPDHDYTQRRAELDGLAEPAVILCWLISQDLGQVQFELNLDDTTNPNATGHLHLLARPDGTEGGTQLQHIELEKRFQVPGGISRILLRQVNTAIQFEVFQIFNDGRNEPPVHVSLAAKDFATLRRDHPAEAERYLRPLLRELHQDAAFAADPTAAWQVLADAWPINDGLKPAVAEQIGLLNGDDFRTRQAAANQLQKLGRDAAAILMKMDRNGLSPEQILAVDEVISRFKPLRDSEAARLSRDPAFLLDCLYGDDPIACKLALDRLRAVTAKPINLELTTTEEARIAAVDSLREKLFPAPTTRP